MANGPPFATLNHVAADLGIPNESEPLRNLKDPRNIAHEYSTTERIRIDADLDALLARILEQHCVVGAGFKRYSFHTQDRDPLLRIHFVLAPDAAFPVKIRVPRAVPIQIRRPAVTSKDGGTDRGSKS